MIGKYKHRVMKLILFIISFCILTSPADAKTEPRIPKNKIVALVYDDSGSMWEQSGANGKKITIDNWKYANYALQSFIALMDTQDQLKIVFMSSPQVAVPIELDQNLRQLGIDHIRAWKGKKSTPINSLHTAINELKTASENHDHSDFWLIVLTDGIFNELNPFDQMVSKTQMEKNKKDLFNRLRDLSEKMEKKGASFHTTLIPIETYLNPEEQNLMADFKRQWKESSDGKVLESKGQLDIIHRINEVAALMTNRDPSEQELFDLNPVLEGNQLVLESPFPLRRITIIEQSAEKNAPFDMKGFYINNKRIEQGIEGPYKIKTPDDTAKLNPPIRGTLTHLKNVNGDTIIESGTYKIVFNKSLTVEQKKNIQVLAEPAIDFRTDFQKINENGRLTSDPSVFFQGSKMRLETTLIKSESTDEEIDIRDLDVNKLFAVNAQIGEENVPLKYDRKLNKFVGNFTLMNKDEIPIKVRVNVKGFYQKEKESTLKAYPVRKMELVANTDSWSAPLNKLDEAKPLKITPKINGEEISTQELKKIFNQLKVETTGNIKIEKKQDGNQILINPKGLTPLFRTSTGEVPLHVTLHGQYPNEVVEGTFTVNIKDISLFKKYGPILLLGLLIILLLLYIVGIIVKPRFDKNRISIEYKQSKRRGRVKDVQPKTLNFHGNLIKRWLVPFVAEKKAIYDLTFKAHKKKDRVFLVKECQEPNLIVNHQKLSEQSKQGDILIMNNDEIQIDRGTYDTIYIFKAH